MASLTALVFYDQLNTLSREVEFMWSQRFSCASLLFHVNRLATLLWGIAVLLQTFLHYDGAQVRKTFLTCNRNLIPMMTRAFAAMRTYALLGGSWLLPAIVFVLGITPVGTNIILVVVATRICLIASDLILLLVTWMKTYATKRQADQLNIKTPLATMLLRDGM
ncbi:hypothetical protein OBBRIDRAFT_735361 [Obba rivulosa]|uniref:DUF6533 domain-containing protein n=1 Tax=Obba rivulosa TaxID=1052685 RepID=A0A8E2ARD2_9APHY|nr:hypothetical protein OBBRIDRAFT_735361 [Obba rivulosa]